MPGRAVQVHPGRPVAAHAALRPRATLPTAREGGSPARGRVCRDVRAAIVACALAVCAVLGRAAPAVGQPSSAPSTSRYGFNDDAMVSPGVTDEVLAAARTAGLGWVTYTIYWNLVEPEAGVYHWGTPDGEIRRLVDAGFNVFARIRYPPPWATGDAPTIRPDLVPWYCASIAPRDATCECRTLAANPGLFTPAEQSQVAARCAVQPPRIPLRADVERFARAVVRRYAVDGPLVAQDPKYRVRYWGFGEEFHNPYLWAGSKEEFLQRVLIAGYDVAKSLDPSLTIVGPDSDWTEDIEFVLRRERELRSAGARAANVVDVISMHVLREAGNGAGAVWRLHRTVPGTNPSLERVFYVKPVLDQGRRGRPFWLTELGACSSPTLSSGCADEAGQASWLAEQLDEAFLQPWIDKVFVYRLQADGSPSPDYGIMAPPPDATSPPVRRPAFTAVETFLQGVGLPTFSYLAEGALHGLFDLDICLANPTEQTVPVRLEFLQPGGDSVIETRVLPPLSRATVDVGTVAGGALRGDVSTVVESTAGPVVAVERTMIWDERRQGGHTGTAVEAPEPIWYFAEGAQYDGLFDTFLLLANPDPRNDALATVKYLREAGGACPAGGPAIFAVRVPAGRRVTLWAGSDGTRASDPLGPGGETLDLAASLAGCSFSIVVTSGEVPIIAERSMYFRGAPGRWEGGHESAGVTSLSEEWFLAEGATGPIFDNYILIGNPNPSDVDVRVRWLRQSGEPIERLYTVPAETRRTVVVEYPDGVVDEAGQPLPPHPDLGGAGTDTVPQSTVVTSLSPGLPIVVERAMYWSGGFRDWYEAHNSFGLTSLGTRWALAEGRVGSSDGAESFDTFILFANPAAAGPGAQAAVVEVTLLREGAPAVRARFRGAALCGGVPGPCDALVVPPSTRVTVRVNDLQDDEGRPLLANERFGARIEAVNGVGIAVERAMYWSVPGSGRLWDGGTNATGTRIP
jgi:hypothetical protein